VHGKLVKALGIYILVILILTSFTFIAKTRTSIVTQHLLRREINYALERIPLSENTAFISHSKSPRIFSKIGNLDPLIVPRYPKSKQISNWTVMIYLDADNDLESAGIDDFMEMSEVGSQSGVNIIVLLDRVNGYDTSYDNWNGTKLFYVTQGITPSASNAIADWGEADMGDPQTLVNFIAWGIQNYPAEHYLVVLWDHGGGMSGVCWDDTNNNDNLNLFEIRNALEAIYVQLGVKIDVLGFDACLMGLIEVAYQLRDYVDYVVFSQETEPGDGWPYNDILSELVSNSFIDPSNLAKLIAQKYIGSYNGGSQGYDDTVTQSAINITYIERRAIAKINVLTGYLLRNYASYKTAINYALQSAESFSDPEQKDLVHFLKLLYSRITDSQLRILINDTLDALSNSILYGGHLSSHPNAYGLSGYFDYYIDYAQIDMSVQHQWDEFIEKINGYEPDIWCYDVIFIGSDNDNDGYYDSSLYLGIDLDASNSRQVDIKIYARNSTGEFSIANSSDLTVSGAVSDDIALVSLPVITGHDNYTFRFEIYDARTNNLVFQLYYFCDDNATNVPLESLPGYPIVEVVSPKPTSIINDIVKVKINASDENDISEVKIKLNNTWYSTVYNTTSGYYEYDLATYLYPEGYLYLSVNATDTGGNSTLLDVYYIVNNLEMYVVNPQEDSIICENVTLQVNVTLNTDHLTIDSVKAKLINSTFASSWLTLQYNSTSRLYEGVMNTTKYSDGSYSLYISAITNQSTFENKSIRVVIDNIVGDILLVDDDEGSYYETYYISALEILGYALGIDFDVWDVATNGSISYDILAKYRVVIWFTGDAYSDTLTTTDQQALVQYLDKGGSLFIAGQDIGFDIGNSTFYIDYLKAYYIQDNVGIDNITGVSDTIFEGLRLSLSGSDSANNNNFPSQIEPTSESEMALYYDDDPSLGAAILYKGSYKLIYFAFSFEAINGAENRAEVMRRVLEFLYMDTNPPILDIITPTNNSYVNVNKVNVSWIGKDLESGIHYYEVKLDDLSWLNVSLNTSYEFTSLSNGEHVIYVRAVDVAGNIKIVHINVTVDTIPPIIKITSPGNDTVFDTLSIKVTWESNDSVSGISHYAIKIDNTAWKDIGEVSYHIVKVSGLGDHIIYVRVYDKAGNYDDAKVSIKIIDDKAPNIFLKSPSNNSYINVTSIDIVFQGDDDISGIDHYEVKIDDLNWINIDTQTRYTIKNLSEGTHIIMLKAVDKMGNERIIVIKVTIDLTSPSIKLLNPTNNTYINTSAVVIEWSASDNLSGIYGYEVRIDYGNWTDVGDNTSYVLVGLSQGSYRVFIRGYDKAGNSKCINVQFIVDTDAPEIEIRFPENGTEFNKYSIMINWTAQDNFGIQEFHIYVDGELYTVLSPTNNTVTVKLGNGWHEIGVVAIDYAGNTAFDSIKIKIQVIEYTPYIIAVAIALIAIIALAIFLKRRV